MKSDKTNKLRDAIIMRGVARRSKRRNQKAISYHPSAEETAEIFYHQRADREAAISETLAAGEWLPIREVFEAVIKKQKAKFDTARRASIEITVFRNIVSDSAEGRLGTEQSPALMLLSNDYFKTLLAPSALAQFLHTFDDLNGDDKDRAITKFLTDHCWIRRTVAAQWLGKDIPLPRPVRSPQEPASMPAIGQCQKWLISKMEANKGEAKSFDAYRDEAKKEFGVGPYQFRKLVWDTVIPKDHPWRKHGRPRKKS